MSSSTSLDFSYLTTRHHAPSRVSILAPRPALKNIEDSSDVDRKKKKGNRNTKKKKYVVKKDCLNGTISLLEASECVEINSADDDLYIVEVDEEDDCLNNENIDRLTNLEIKGDIDIDKKKKEKELELKERIGLVNLTRLLIEGVSPDQSLNRYESEKDRKRIEESISPVLHEMNLDDWELGINWEGANCKDVKEKRNILEEVIDPTLESMDFSKEILWNGANSNSKDVLQTVAKNSRLVLNSSLNSCLEESIIPSRRPEPFVQSEAYGRRYEREMQSKCVTTASVTASLGRNSEQMEAVIAQRQAKRAQMAIDKSHRVTEAMGTLALGGGKGRTITSSLMGPGGTERTGRPSRHDGSSSAHNAEFIEQCEFVYNHTLVKPDLKKSELRQFHRPRLLKCVVRVERPWQFQVRIPVVPKKKSLQGDRIDSSTVVYYNTNLQHGNADMNQKKIRSEADLCQTHKDGSSLFVLEYCEERPPIQLSKGMASKVVNYYRGDRSKAPISAGGGDRPIRKREGSSKKSTTTAATKSNEKFSALQVAKNVNVKDLIGTDFTKKVSKKKKETTPPVDILSEGVTEVMHPKVHGVFIGEVEEGTTQTGIISNLFDAPIFRHESKPCDFLMTLQKKPLNSSSSTSPLLSSHRFALSVILNKFPTNIYLAGQTEPRIKIFAPNTTGEKNFTAPFQTYQIAKALEKTEKKENRGLRFDEINDRLFANTLLLPNALRQRIKQVAIYDKITQIWTTNRLDMKNIPE